MRSGRRSMVLSPLAVRAALISRCRWMSAATALFKANTRGDILLPMAFLCMAHCSGKSCRCVVVEGSVRILPTVVSVDAVARTGWRTDTVRILPTVVSMICSCRRGGSHRSCRVERRCCVSSIVLFMVLWEVLRSVVMRALLMFGAGCVAMVDLVKRS